MRRLDFAREQIARHRPLVEVALEAGFADQAHFTRMFKAAFGLTPARYGALRAHDVNKVTGYRLQVTGEQRPEAAYVSKL